MWKPGIGRENRESFGGGILAKLMCAAPKKIEKAVFIVPAGINNAVPVSSMAMMIPLLQYRITRQEKYLRKTAMPTNIEEKRLGGYCFPTMVVAAEKDCLFPAGKVLRRARKIIPGCLTVELKGSGHMHILPQTVKEQIVGFLRND